MSDSIEDRAVQEKYGLLFLDACKLFGKKHAPCLNGGERDHYTISEVLLIAEYASEFAMWAQEQGYERSQALTSDDRYETLASFLKLHPKFKPVASFAFGFFRMLSLITEEELSLINASQTGSNQTRTLRSADRLTLGIPNR